jgi:hypothetical protein
MHHFIVHAYIWRLRGNSNYKAAGRTILSMI